MLGIKLKSFRNA